MLMQVIEETICEQSENSKFGTGFGTWSFRTLDLVRNFGGERGIRTLEGLLTLTPLAGVRLRPLGHLSGGVSRARKDKARPLRRKAAGGRNLDSGLAGRLRPAPEISRRRSRRWPWRALHGRPQGPPAARV